MTRGAGTVRVRSRAAGRVLWVAVRDETPREIDVRLPAAADAGAARAWSAWRPATRYADATRIRAAAERVEARYRVRSGAP